MTDSNGAVLVEKKEFFLRQMTISGGVDFPTVIKYEENRAVSQFLCDI